MTVHTIESNDKRLIATRYRVLAPGLTFGQSTVREFEWPKEPSYKQLRELVLPLLGGEFVNLEHVSVLEDFDGGAKFKALDMFVDEDFQAKRLTRNDAATLTYRRATMLGRSGAPVPKSPEELDLIAGPAVLFDRKVWY